MTIEELIALIEEAIERSIDSSDRRQSLATIGLDSLDLVTVAVSLDAEYGAIELPATEGMIDPAWSIAELHHFVQAFLERQHSSDG